VRVNLENVSNGVLRRREKRRPTLTYDRGFTVLLVGVGCSLGCDSELQWRHLRCLGFPDWFCRRLCHARRSFRRGMERPHYDEFGTVPHSIAEQ
jgi:hypothetical protein